MIPRRGSPALTPSYQAQRDMLTIAETAIAAMQRNASETIAQVSIASINALRDRAAHAASMERAQQTLERIRAPDHGRAQDAGTGRRSLPRKRRKSRKQSAQRACKGSGEGKPDVAPASAPVASQQPPWCGYQGQDRCVAPRRA